MAQLIEVRPGRNISVHVKAPENGSNGTMFFIHGGGGRKEQWNNQIKHFERQFKTVAFDFPGHGQSPQTIWSEYNYKQIVQDFLVLFNQHKGQSNVIVAHSMGTAIALHSLIELKRLELISSVKKVILIGARSSMSRRASYILAYTPTFLLNWMRPLVSKGFKKAAWHESTPLELIMSEKAAADNNSMYMMKALLSQLEWPTKAQIEELATVTGLRVLLITGETDGLTPVSGAQVLAEWLGPVADPLISVENAGHMVMLERPEPVNALMSTFVNS